MNNYILNSVKVVGNTNEVKRFITNHLYQKYEDIIYNSVLAMEHSYFFGETEERSMYSIDFITISTFALPLIIHLSKVYYDLEFCYSWHSYQQTFDFGNVIVVSGEILELP
ncbi:hypothetical protein [Dysgonomonas sp. HGC4]|uniref:hypothetical protein n=1 Tax=Dysgonomonas sp. HGC4 TaxID=1658009 RepID=UPI00068321AF|nr:hypothetical protein [Dysgonomonas sp. HGC4]MBD8348977.1 hypothetical protein [Dysgonomonas sp. HGC4]